VSTSWFLGFSFLDCLWCFIIFYFPNFPQLFPRFLCPWAWRADFFTLTSQKARTSGMCIPYSTTGRSNLVSTITCVVLGCHLIHSATHLTTHNTKNQTTPHGTNFSYLRTSPEFTFPFFCSLFFLFNASSFSSLLAFFCVSSIVPDFPDCPRCN